MLSKSFLQKIKDPSLVRNVAFNWGSTATAIGYSLFITPIVVRALDKELYGIWSFLNGIITYSDLLYLGLGSSLIRDVALLCGSDKREQLSRLIRVILSIYAVLGCLCVLAGFIAASFIKSLFAHPIADSSVSEAQLTCLLLGIRLFALFVASVFSGVLVGQGRTDISKILSISFTVIRFFAIPLLVSLPNPLLMLALATTATAILECGTLAVMVCRLNHGLHLGFAFPRRSELWSLYSFGLKSFFILLSVKLISYTDTTVIGLVIGASAVALYSIPLQLIEYGRIAVAGIVNVLLPSLTVMNSEGDLAGLRAAYLKSARVCFFIAAFINVNIIFLGVSFLHMWVGKDFADAAYYVLLYLATASIFQSLSTQLALPFYQALQRFRRPTCVLIIEGLANLCLSIYLAPRHGITGVALATLIPTFLISFVILPHDIAKQLNCNTKDWFSAVVQPAMILIILCIGVFIVINRVLTIEAYWVIGAKGIIMSIVAAFTFYVSFPDDERIAIQKALQHVFGMA